MVEYHGPFKRVAEWIAEKVADFLLGGDVLDPRRDGTEIDWEGVEVTKVRRSIVAVMARMNLELALLAANRRVEGAFEEEQCRDLVVRAKELVERDAHSARLSDDCSVVVKYAEGDLVVQVSGSGPEFEVLCDELWNRSKEVREQDTKKPGLKEPRADEIVNLS